jgi:hypothetical protein
MPDPAVDWRGWIGDIEAEARAELVRDLRGARLCDDCRGNVRALLPVDTKPEPSAHEAHELSLLERGRALYAGEIECYLADRQTPIRHATADVGTEIAAQLYYNPLRERIAEAATDPENHAYGCPFSTSHLHDEACNCWLRSVLA